MNLELWEKDKNGNLGLGAIREDGGCGGTRRSSSWCKEHQRNSGKEGISREKKLPTM